MSKLLKSAARGIPRCHAMLRVIFKSFVVMHNVCRSQTGVVGQASSLSIRNDGQSSETRDRRHQIIFSFHHYF
jgi:hypothetical protein